MFKNYLKITLRNFRKHLMFSSLNIFGLALGLASTILILLWVQHELSYDGFNKNEKSLYRITVEGLDMRFAMSQAPLAEALKKTMPEVKNTARLDPASNLFEVGNVHFEEKNGFFADPSFLELFTYPLVKGDAKTALSTINGILITEALAEKFFHTRDALGKHLRMDKKDEFVVTGVLKNIPATSHLQFNYLLPIAYLKNIHDPSRYKSWNGLGVYSYVQLKHPLNSSELVNLETKINNLYKSKKADIEVKFQLQSLDKIHLHSKFLMDVSGHGNIQYVRIFTVAALFILLLACINFINLSTAQYTSRAKEVGLRKVIGADRKNLIFQFLGESFLMVLLAFILAVILVILLLPAFNQLSGKSLTISLFDGQFFTNLFALIVITSLISGGYPAFFLSSFLPVNTLKGKLGTGDLNKASRSILVVVQFVITVVLLSGTIIIYNQLQYIKFKNLGFDKENLLYIPVSNVNKDILRNELAQNTLTKTFCGTYELPVNMSSTIRMGSLTKEQKDPLFFSEMRVDEMFIRTLNMQFISGKNFVGNSQTDQTSCIINERALQILNLKASSAIGKTIMRGRDTVQIVGVVKNFNFKPLHEAIEPLVINYSKRSNYFIVRTPPGKAEATLAALKNIWKKSGVKTPFEYNFLNDDLDKLYQTETRMSELSKAFAALAIFISCIGLYGLVAFTAEQRIKEIGIRKVLGASVSDIVGLLSGNFMKRILIAIIISLPLTVYLMNGWLQNFAYHIQIQWWMLFMACASSLVIALLTVSFHCIKAAVANPIKSLRTE